MRAICLIALALAASALVPCFASATSITYGSRADFSQAIRKLPGLGSSMVEGWDGFPSGTVFENGTGANGITYSVTAGFARVVSTGISLSQPNNLYTTNPSVFRPLVDTFTFDFERPIRAFGITFSSTYANRPGDYYALTDTGERALSSFDPVWPGGDIGEFVGLVADRPFSAVTIGSSANAYYGMDDLVMAAPVPLPASLFLMGLGLGALALLRRTTA